MKNQVPFTFTFHVNTSIYLYFVLTCFLLPFVLFVSVLQNGQQHLNIRIDNKNSSET